MGIIFVPRVVENDEGCSVADNMHAAYKPNTLFIDSFDEG